MRRWVVLGLVTTAVRADEPNAKATDAIVSDANASDAKIADAKKAADLKWAKGIAADFFHQVFLRRQGNHHGQRLAVIR